MKLYRGMSEAQFATRTGLLRRSDCVEGQFSAGGISTTGRDPKQVAKFEIGAGDARVTIAPCFGNSLYLHSRNSELYPHALLSFTTSFDVAKYFSLVQRQFTDKFGVVIEADSRALESAGFSTHRNFYSHEYEEEVSVCMTKNARLPDALILRTHNIDLCMLRASALALHEKYSGRSDVSVPDFLKNVDHPYA